MYVVAVHVLCVPFIFNVYFEEDLTFSGLGLGICGLGLGLKLNGLVNITDK